MTNIIPSDTLRVLWNRGVVLQEKIGMLRINLRSTTTIIQNQVPLCAEDLANFESNTTRYLEELEALRQEYLTTTQAIREAVIKAIQ